MLKMFYLLFLSVLLTSNGLSINFFSNKTLDFSYQNVNHVAESVFYTESVIGTEPNDSPINGFNQDISKFSQNISYSTANVITYNLNSGMH